VQHLIRWWHHLRWHVINALPNNETQVSLRRVLLVPQDIIYGLVKGLVDGDLAEQIVPEIR